MTREPVHRKNARAMAALGIDRIDFEKQKGLLAVWRVTLSGGESFSVETPGLGTESTVLRIAARKLEDRPVRYVA
jgi:hypothetical protein